MTNYLRGIAFGVLIAFFLLTFGQAQEIKSPAKEVLSLAKQAQSDKDINKELLTLKKKFGGIRATMNMYNGRSRGGIGYGPKARSIEGRLVTLGEQTLTADQLKKESDELSQVAHINRIMAEIARGFAPKKEFLGRGKKEWERDLDTVKKGSESLLKALKDNDPKAVRIAATQINTACNKCHDGDK